MSGTRESFTLEKRLAIVILLLLLPVGLFMMIPEDILLGPRVDREILAAQKPNILFIQIDSLRADYLQRYGFPTSTAPFLESLFDRGVVFDKAIAPAYLTFQTDAAIFSGLYPSQNNVQTWSSPIRKELTLFTKMLKVNNYTLEAYVSPSLYEYFGFFKDFDTFTAELRNRSAESNAQNILTSVTQRNAAVPYFTFWHIYDVHLPYIEPYTSQYSGVFASSTNWLWSDQSTSTIRRHKNADYYSLTEDDYEYLREAYIAGIKHTDSILAGFFEDFKSKHEDQFDNTIIILTAEHGEDLEEHGFTFHRDLYDVNTHVPLAIVYPKALRPQRITTPVSLLDLPPTILELTGTAPTETTSFNEGISLLSLMEGSLDPYENRYIFSERAPFEEYAVWQGPYKYILRNPSMRAYTPTIEINDGETNFTQLELFFTYLRRNDTSWQDELYDTSTDPLEQNNLIGTGVAKEHTLKSIVSDFALRMKQERAKYEHATSSDPAIPLTYP